MPSRHRRLFVCVIRSPLPKGLVFRNEIRPSIQEGQQVFDLVGRLFGLKCRTTTRWTASRQWSGLLAMLRMRSF